MLINITLVILLLIVFSYLNGKINNLENEIRALKKRNLIKEENIDSTLKVQEEKPLPESFLTFNNRKTEEIISDNIIQDYLNKENSWIDEVLGFVKQNVLTIIGILTLVIGIGYFVKSVSYAHASFLCDFVALVGEHLRECFLARPEGIMVR